MTIIALPVDSVITTCTKRAGVRPARPQSPEMQVGPRPACVAIYPFILAYGNLLRLATKRAIWEIAHRVLTVTPLYGQPAHTFVCLSSLRFLRVAWALENGCVPRVRILVGF
jgi:hypothetical protein